MGGPDTLVGDVEDIDHSTADHPSVDLEEGEPLGRYRLLERVGSGGMGVVYAAYDPKLDRRVALKVLKGRGFRGSLGPDARSRLRREAQAMAKLSHTNVVAVHDVGSLGEEVFLAMEFIEGRSLREWLHDAHDWREIVDVFLQAGRGLSAAHAAGLVHRDFKPDNVLVGDNGRVVVTDFGLARRLEVSDATIPTRDEVDVTEAVPALSGTDVEDESELLNPSDAVRATAGQGGTPAYMAPEQHEPEAEVTAAADQFSFCVALYEALVGKHPFRGSDPVSLAMAVVAGDRRPSSIEARSVPRRIRKVLDRGLRCVPTERFPNMRSLLAHLNPRSSAQRNAKWVFAGLGGVLGVTGVGAWFTETGQASCADARQHIEAVWSKTRRHEISNAFEATALPFAEQSWRAVEQSVDAYSDQWAQTHTRACEATVRGEQSQTLLDRRMRCLDRRREALSQLGDVLEQADTETVLRALNAVDDLPDISACNDLEALQREYAAPPPHQAVSVNQAQMLRLRAEALLGAGKYAEGRDLAGQAYELAVATEHPPLVARTRLTVGHAAALQGKYARAESQSMQTIADAKIARDSHLEARAWLQWLRIVGFNLKRHEEAERFVPLVRAAIGGVREPTALLGRLESIRGLIATSEREYDVAAEHFALSLRHLESPQGGEAGEIAVATARLATALIRAKRNDEAAEKCELAAERLRASFGPNHPEHLHTSRVCAGLDAAGSNAQ